MATVAPTEAKKSPVPSDIEIAQKSKMLRISEVAKKLGIPEEALARLGRPFEQVESQLTKRYGGSGLGLAIAKSLTELHHGAMRIRSTLGTGTIVLVRLPIDGGPVIEEMPCEAVA